jgi:superfamily II DNA or RNA helicase
MASRDLGLFIVDNSISGRTAQGYLDGWCANADSFDIATGYFEIGALLALDGKWQSLKKIRILLGSEHPGRTRKALLETVESRALEALNTGLEGDKGENPFLRGVPGILEGLNSGQIECRVYDKSKFHAKTYLIHAGPDGQDSRALVGSSNFTGPGLTKNIELNIQVQSGGEVQQLQEWFDSHWQEAVDVTPTIVKAVERHIRDYLPFDVYAKALQEYFRGHELTANEWDETRSRMFPRIDRYQKEAYWALMKIANQHGGAFLCDGVGLGKTFVGLMLIERLVVQEGKRVVLFAPKAARESVWEPHIRKFLSHLGGTGGFSNLVVYNHTDLPRGGDFPERFANIAAQADAVVIDEAHHFRNTGRRGDEARGIAPSRYHLLRKLLNHPDRPKRLFLLTATPINNSLNDFRHMIELFTQDQTDYFAATLGVPHLISHFNQMRKNLEASVGHEVADIEDHLQDVQQLLATDVLFSELVVQRSRAYARESQLRETGAAAAFPERQTPQVATYSIKKTYGRLLDMFEAAFNRSSPLFTLPMYYPLNWYQGKDATIDPFDQNRQKQVVGLIRTNFLKRFESSFIAFITSCERLAKKLLAFIEVHAETPAELKRLDRWKGNNLEVLGRRLQRELDLTGEEDEADDDLVTPELREAIEKKKLDRAEYDVGTMIEETFLDLDELVKFLQEGAKFEAKHDDKLQCLIRSLKSKDLKGHKVIIFSEFADTARYLKTELTEAGFEGVEEVDSGTKGNRKDYIECFSPYYNDQTSGSLADTGRKEIQILISTDVLSEGLNLQDASRMINYDIHWNPVRLMQRIGRVDRRMNPALEESLKRDHPALKASRGKVWFWNFLPPDELNSLLSLYNKVTQKTLVISKTLGIEGRQLLTPDDNYDPLKEFNTAYEGTRTAVEDMHLEYQALLKDNAELEAYLQQLPGGFFSGRGKTSEGKTGVFLCYALPALDRSRNDFTLEAGPVRWYFYHPASGAIDENAGNIVAHIRSLPDTPRHCVMPDAELLEIRKKVEQHIKQSYLRRVDAPAGVRPVLRCWMELNGD